MKFWLAFLSVAIFTGCFEDPESEALPYPPLRKEELVGCWKYAETIDSCLAECFDRMGGYYRISEFYNPDLAVAEDSGEYWVDGNKLRIESRFRTSQGKFESNLFTFSQAVIDGKLIWVDGGVIHSDLGWTKIENASLPCSLKPWTLFQKPAGWDSLIKPY